MSISRVKGLKQCKQARMRYAAGVQSLPQFFEAVSLHQLLARGSRYLWLGHSSVCYTRSCISFSSYFFLLFLLSLSPFLRLCFYITFSFPPFFTSTFSPPLYPAITLS